MKTLWIAVVGIVLIASASVWGQSIQPTLALPQLVEDASHGLPQNEIPPTLLFSIPIGEKGISYAGVGIEDMEDWGPSSIKTDVEGNIWIADAVAHRLLQYTRSGALRVVVTLPKEVVSVHDFAPTTEGLWVADRWAQTPAVILVGFDGTLVEKHNLPPGSETFMGGVAIDPFNRPVVSIGSSVLAIGNAKRSVEAIWDESDIPASDVMYPPVKVARNKMLSTQSAGYFVLESDTGSYLEALPGDVWMSYLGSDKGDAHFMEVNTTLGEHTIDTTIHRYDSNLRRYGVARFPAERFLYNINNPMTVSSDGSVIGMVTYPDRVDVVQLSFSRSLEPLEFEDVVFEEELFGVASADKACIKRSKIHTNAIDYRINRTYLSTSAISGSCSGRQKPRYLGSAGYYDSVAYDWGGFDSVGMFNQAMTTSSMRAGDTNTSVESCSRGVDCSGFVSRVWGLTTKYSTSTLKNVSKAISKSQLKEGDILNKSGDHVVLYVNSCTANGSAGYLVYEATVSSTADKVVRQCRKTSEFGPYEARKFNNVCS